VPEGKTLVTFGSRPGRRGPVVGHDPYTRRRDFAYPGKPPVGFVADYNARTVKVGETVTGTAWALCR
jgi:hypothetical protein